MGIRKEIREGKDMKESEQIYANLNMKKTGENIRSRRERLGMNRPDIQKKMGLAGVQSVWNWEKGKKMPNIENLFALAEILHTTVDDLCVPLRYNNDKQKKPLFSRGLSVCRLLFNSFSKLKIDENYKEKRRLFY